LKSLKQIWSTTPVRVWLILRCSSIVVGSAALIYKVGRPAFRSLTTLIEAPWYSYDAEYYIRIVSVGYQRGDITSGFHPLYPWIAHAVALLIGDPLLSLLLVSTIAGLLLTLMFYRLAQLETTADRAWVATALFLCWPITVAIFAPYTEALHLLLAVSCLYAARKNRFWLSGVAGGLTALTRQHGIFLVIPIAWELWEASHRDLRKALRSWQRWLSIMLVPAGYLLWILYRAVALNDVAPDLSSPQKFIFSVMVSPTAYGVYREQQFLLPWVALWKAILMYAAGKVHWSAYGDAFFAALLVAMLVFAWRYLRVSYRLYSLAIILLALSYHTGTSFNPYTSLPRHMLPAFPIFIGVAMAYKFRRLNFVLFMLGVCQALFLCCFVWQSWVL
jgi:4-amino-4-deoxy-L-arabinose transferase-like glycosyltransferase